MSCLTLTVPQNSTDTLIECHGCGASLRVVGGAARHSAARLHDAMMRHADECSASLLVELAKLEAGE